ncbi:MAG: helix-turn-helix domain-containing protein [Patescibacteria group bacterium]|nr:helix-turn-helix domain-containing protein [Patescibacteria group bacterium]
MSQATQADQNQQTNTGDSDDQYRRSDRKTGRMRDAAKLDLNNLPDLLTVREVADLLRVSPLTIKRWGKRGKLPAIRINSRGDRRYKKESVLWLLGIDPDEQEE